MSDKTKPISLAKAEIQERALIQEVAMAHQNGQRKRADHFGRMYLKSFAPRLIAAHSAARALKLDRPSKTRLREIAGKLDAWAGSTESVLVHFKAKASNPHEYRPIMDFGIENRVLQHLVAPVLKARADLHPNQYCIRGGIHAAIAKVSKALLGGYRWVIEADIANCYPSFNGEKVPEVLPMPKEVTRRIILSRDLNLVPGNFREWFGPDDGMGGDDEPLAQAIAEARRGIPQGSAVSPLVAEMLLAPVFTQLPDYGIVVAYADNILIMAREENEAVSICEALWWALKSHPAGPLRPKEPKPFRPGQTVTFLGHSLTAKWGKCRVEPSHSNLQEFKAVFSKGMERITSPNLSEQRRLRAIRDLCRYVRSWAAAFALWEQAPIHRAYYLSQIEEVTSPLGTSIP